MKSYLLQKAVQEIKANLSLVVENAKYKEKHYRNGLEAKTAFIRSETLIQKIHEFIKISIHEELKRRKIRHVIHPPIGNRSP